MEYLAIVGTLALGLFLGWLNGRGYQRIPRERRLVEARLTHRRPLRPGRRHI